MICPSRQNQKKTSIHSSFLSTEYGWAIINSEGKNVEVMFFLKMFNWYCDILNILEKNLIATLTQLKPRSWQAI